MMNEYSAWNPGLESDIPPPYQQMETIYRPENVSSRFPDVAEASKQTGLNPRELVVFKPERLMLHELIIRVTASVVVPEGHDETELGRNFRQITSTILKHSIQPRMEEVTDAYDRLNTEVRDRVSHELIDSLFTTPEPQAVRKRFFFRGFFQKAESSPSHQESILEREYRVIATFKEKGLAANEPFSRVVYKGLYRILGLIAGTRGYLGPDRDFLIDMVSNYVCNSYGSRVVGGVIAPWVDKAIAEQGYSRVSYADNPILVSLKGASAAGKSSLRPMLKRMMSEKGMRTQGYMTISPDIWRRLLLDYHSLGEAFKYAGRLTSHEVIIIDTKLDLYLREQASQRGSIPHLLVDRFRFDSFSSEGISRILHDTYVKYVDTMYMYFVITPPHATVERGWERGLTTGRYKSVEDFLDHSVEAYTGIPKMLFKWLACDRPVFRYEFLDNSVPKDTFPRTVAYGTRKELSIIDCKVLLEIGRYQKINIRARAPEEVYPEADPSVAGSMGFLRQCIKRIPRVSFIDEATGVTYAGTHRGKFQIIDAAMFTEKLGDRQLAEIFELLTSGSS
ncbi:MAG: hypothetical protein GY703_09715 [Gammaproteobacteria bacterium]|nr:hypothetical protein [Gammaproteobacteria bacterium]